MTAETYDPHRTAQAALIAGDPHLYKVCIPCESIVTKGLDVCTNCGGYRFEEQPHMVSAHALKIAMHDQKSVTAKDLEG